MTTTHKGLAVQVDNDSLGDVPFEAFETIFRNELETALPGVEITIDCGIGSREEWSGMAPDGEIVHECGERAFKKTINSLNL